MNSNTKTTAPSNDDNILSHSIEQGNTNDAAQGDDDGPLRQVNDRPNTKNVQLDIRK